MTHSTSSVQAPNSSNSINSQLLTPDSQLSTPNLLLALASPPTSADLSQTIEVQFTPEITAKAEYLQHNPVKIYNWVRNNIEFVPTYGSIQGANMCLQTKQCNAFDTSSLLIALLRASNIPAKYVQGTVEIPIEKVKNWVGGFTDSNSALSFIASGGIPVGGITEGGQITYVQMEHVWVEAWIDYIPSRGARHKVGDTWIPLDASFKQHDFKQGIDLSAAVPFDSSELYSSLVNSATINDTEGWVTGIDGSLVKTTMADYNAQVEAYLIQNDQNLTIEDIVGTIVIVKHEFPILMGTLPYKTLVKGALYREIPDKLRYKLGFSIVSENIYSDVSPLAITYSLPQIEGKRITVSYSPATPSDEAVINKYLPKPHTDGTPIQLTELPTSLPAYLIHLKPELRLDGQVVATGGSITMGSVEKFSMIFIDPVRKSEVVINSIEAGEYWGVAVNVSRLSGEVMKVAHDRLMRTEAKLSAGDVSGLTADDILGEMLFYTAMLYNARIDGHASVLARSMGVSSVRLPSEAVFKSTIKVDSVFGVPISASAGGIMIDVDRSRSLVKALDGDNGKKLKFMRYSGINSSVFEHRVPEQLFTRAAAPAEGVSAVKALQIANDSKMPIYTITRDNISIVLPQLQLDAVVITDIRNAVNAGKTVIVSKTNISDRNWIGCGYIVTDPTTGNGDYIVSGGESGAYIMIINASIVTGNPLVIATGFALLKTNLFESLASDFVDFVGIGKTEPKDWCGDESNAWVPDYPFGIDAAHACMLHDYCYANGITYDNHYAADQAACDRILGAEIYKDCIGQGGYTKFQCGFVSDIYWLFVTIRGGNAFDEARNQ